MLKALFEPSAGTLTPEMATYQVLAVGRRVVRVALRELLALCPRQAHRRRARDLIGDRVLNRNNLRPTLVERFGPHGCPIQGINLSDRQPNAIAGALHPPYEQRVHVELAPSHQRILS